MYYMNLATVKSTSKNERWNNILPMIGTEHIYKYTWKKYGYLNPDTRVILVFYAFLVLHLFGQIELAQMVFDKYGDEMDMYENI